MTEVDLSGITAPFAALDADARIDLAGQVADQLERLLDAAEQKDIAMSEIMRARIIGALVALRAVCGRQRPAAGSQ